MKRVFEKLVLVSAAFGLTFFVNPKHVMANHCGFLDPTCSHNGCNDLDVTCNPNVKPITKPISEAAWGEAGSSAYKAAAATMRGRHGSSVGLDDIQKKYLRPHYGNLVDQVVVVYNAKMMNEWTALGKKIPLGGVESAAQTYCNRIYVRDSYQKGNRDQLLLLAHELRHSQQCQELGGEGKFGYHYFREYKRAGLSYENNALELSAQERANTIARNVPDNLISASSSVIPQPDEESNRPRLIPLALYWNGQREDNSTVATLAMRRSQEQSGYAGPNIQGCILSKPETGTIPLLLFWHPQREDNVTVATEGAIQSQIDSGYGNRAVQGYIYSAEQPGTIPLLLFWHPQREDNATVATKGAIRSQIDSGYGNPAIQGYIYPADKCSR
jgi:hypothetical protein